MRFGTEIGELFKAILNVFDSGYSRQFISEELQSKLLEAVQEQYPEAESLTAMGAGGATGLKTQQTLTF